jgi:hypothetical protein
MALERELDTYRRELPRLLQDEGKFVLVHGDEVAGVYDTEESAVEAGDDRFGLEPFLVKQISRSEEPRLVPYDLTPPCPS